MTDHMFGDSATDFPYEYEVDQTEWDAGEPEQQFILGLSGPDTLLLLWQEFIRVLLATATNRKLTTVDIRDAYLRAMVLVAIDPRVDSDLLALNCQWLCDKLDSFGYNVAAPATQQGLPAAARRTVIVDTDQEGL